MPIKFLVLGSYLGMVVVNVLANALPINNLSTGAISDLYPNLFTPAGLTFSIWGLIYLLLGLYVVYQFGFFQKDKSDDRQDLLKKLGVYFVATSVANAAWIFAWHYMMPGLSLAIMIALLACLIKIADLLRGRNFSRQEKFLIRLPFAIYFGWITVATIANVTVFLVSLGWNGFGIAPSVWTVIILLVGAAIGIARMAKDRSIAYGLVFVWAYAGILIKHTSSTGFAGEHGNVIAAAWISILAILAAATVIWLKDRQKSKSLKN